MFLTSFGIWTAFYDFLVFYKPKTPEHIEENELKGEELAAQQMEECKLKDTGIFYMGLILTVILVLSNFMLFTIESLLV